MSSEQVSEVTVTSYEIVVRSDAGRDSTFDAMVEALPQRKWTRGDSGMQGAWYVSTLDSLGSKVKIWCYDEEPDLLYVGFSNLDGPKASQEAAAGWRKEVATRLLYASQKLGKVESLSGALIDLLTGMGVDVSEYPETGADSQT